MLTKEVDKYYEKKGRQCLKMNAILFRIIPVLHVSGFEKQLDECKTSTKQMEKNTIKYQLDEERKRLKAEYSKVFDDIRNLSHSIKQQLDQYKSRLSLDKAIIEKDIEINKLNSPFSHSKNEIKDLRKALSFAKMTIKALDDDCYLC